MDWERFLEIYPKCPNGEEWNMGCLSQNPNVPFSLALKRRDLAWQWEGFSGNPALPLSYALDHLEVRWNWALVLQHSLLTFDQVLTSSFLMPSIWRKLFTAKIDLSPLSANRAITLEIIRSQPQFPWRKEHLSENPNLTIDFLRRPPTHLLGEWDWNALTANPAFPFALQVANRDLPWNVLVFCCNPSLREADIFAHPWRIPADSTLAQLNQMGYAGIFCSHPQLMSNPSMSLRFIRRYLYLQPGFKTALLINTGHTLGELMQLYSVMGEKGWSWTTFALFGGQTSDWGLLRDQLINPYSYLSFLPHDLAYHYFPFYLPDQY